MNTVQEITRRVGCFLIIFGLSPCSCSTPAFAANLLCCAAVADVATKNQLRISFALKHQSFKVFVHERTLTALAAQYLTTQKQRGINIILFCSLCLKLLLKCSIIV